LRCWPPVPWLAALATSALVLQTGSLPHTHTGPGIGLYNQEHDLTLLTSLAVHANPVDPSWSSITEGTSAAVPDHVPAPRAVRDARSGHTRAPPSA
jgi:hypothetical protein